MAKTLMLSLGLLLCATWLSAQTMEKGQSGKMSNQTSVEGCLQGSNGAFTLTDNSGTTYQLEGDTSKLSEHVGHEVQVTGTPSESSATSGASSNSAMAPNTHGSQALTVQKMKHISKTCKSVTK